MAHSEQLDMDAGDDALIDYVAYNACNGNISPEARFLFQSHLLGSCAGRGATGGGGVRVCCVCVPSCRRGATTTACSRAAAIVVITAAFAAHYDDARSVCLFSRH